MPNDDLDWPAHPPSLIRLHCPHEEAMAPWLPMEHPVKTDHTLQMHRLMWVFAGCMGFRRFCHALTQFCNLFPIFPKIQPQQSVSPAMCQPIQHLAKTMFRLHGCTCRSESSLGTHMRFNYLTCFPFPQNPATTTCVHHLLTHRAPSEDSDQTAEADLSLRWVHQWGYQIIPVHHLPQNPATTTCVHHLQTSSTSQRGSARVPEVSPRLSMSLECSGQNQSHSGVLVYSSVLAM